MFIRIIIRVSLLALLMFHLKLHHLSHFFVTTVCVFLHFSGDRAPLRGLIYFQHSVIVRVMIVLGCVGVLTDLSPIHGDEAG